jgi:hypothetical protein
LWKKQEEKAPVGSMKGEANAYEDHDLDPDED